MTIAERILSQNKGRDEQRLALKAIKMAQSPFALFRAQAGFFYEQAQELNGERDAPLAWLSGDAHLENIGAYSAANGQSVIDITDFDEAHLGRVWTDVARFTTSLELAASAKGIPAPEREALMKAGLQGYQQELVSGKARWLDGASSEGLHKALIAKSEQTLGAHNNNDKERIISSPEGPRLRPGYGKTYPAHPGDAERARAICEDYNARQGKRYELLDLGRRASGLGSLGQERYALLLRSESGELRVADAKLCYEGAFLRSHMLAPQPLWECHAQRVMRIQEMMQAIEPPMLGFARLADGSSFLIKELLPSSRRLDIEKWNGDGASMLSTAAQWGRVISWGHLRASGRLGAAPAQNLVDWAARLDTRPLLDGARAMARHFESLHAELVKDPAFERWIKLGEPEALAEQERKIADKLARKRANAPAPAPEPLAKKPKKT